MIFLEEKQLRRKYIFTNSIRIAILSVLAIVSLFIYLFIETPFPVKPLIYALLCAIVLSIPGIFISHLLGFRLIVYCQAVIDIIVITFLVYISGGIVSPFYFLYILPIIVVSIFLTRRDTVYIAILSFFVFGMLANLMFLELIPILKGIPEPDISEGSFIYNLLISFLAFSSIAIISSYYFEKIKRTGTELQNIQAHLKDMVLLNTTVLEKMENGFVTSDSQGVIISYNEKSKSLMKLNSTTNIFRHLFSEHDYKCVENLGFDKPKYYFERKLHDLYLGITVSFIENIYSFKKVYVFIVTDLTEKKDIEEMLKKKDHFALIGEVSAGIAHEIRNPLASISGSVQFLSKELQLNDEYKNLMNIIVNESQRLSKSIEGFLDFTKSSPLEKTAIDLSAMINDVIELISLSHQKIQFIKRIEQNIVFFADIKKMKQVLWNLFTNAVKAVPNEGGIIEILTYRKNNDYYLSIRDNGIGIEKNDLEKLFTPFYSKFTSGIGLGMALVKRILDEHHFEIEIKSQINVGTEVILCLKNN